jgi:hypothetical protein
VTNLAQKLEDGEGILRMVEVMYTNGEEFSFKKAFGHVAIVLQPMTP